MKTLLLCFFSLNLYASNIKTMDFGIGQFYELPNQTNTSESEIFNLSPTLFSSLNYQLNPKWSVHPELSWVIYKKSENKSSNQNIFLPRIDFEYILSERISLYIGTSLFIYSSSGDGSEEKLNNGDGETTYYAPNERRNSYQQTLDFSGSYKLDESYIKLSFYTYKFLNNELREYSLSLSFIKEFNWSKE